MKNDKNVNGQTVRKNKGHKGMWDVIGAGKNAGKVVYTGSMKEIRAALAVK